MTMRIPQLDEVAEIMRLANAPNVLSIGERCDHGIRLLLAPILRASILCQA
jgi:hypothetical protein